MTEKVVWKMDDALESLKSLIEINKELISIKNNVE